MEIQEKIFTLLAFPEVVLTFVKVEKVTSELIHCLLNHFWGAWFFTLVLQWPPLSIYVLVTKLLKILQVLYIIYDKTKKQPPHP